MGMSVYLALGHADEVAGLECRHGLRERKRIGQTLNKSHALEQRSPTLLLEIVLPERLITGLID